MTLKEWFALTEDQAAKWYDDHNVGRDISDPHYAKPEFTLSFMDQVAYDRWRVDFKFSDQLECIALVCGRDGSIVATITPKI